MGIFNQKSKFKAAPPTIRKEEVVIERPKPKPRPVVVSSASGLQVPKTAARKIKTPSASPRASPGLRQSASPYPPSSDEKRPDLKRKIRNGASHRPSPASDRIEFDKDDSESDDDWEDALDARKRRKRALMMNTETRDPDRKMPHPDLLGIANEDKIRKKEMQLVHAVDVASLKLKCSPTLNAPPEEVALKLQYPGSKQRERYELVAGREKIDVVKEIITVVKYVADVYLDDDEAKPLTNRENGIIRRLERASSTAVWDYKAFKSAVSDFNDRLLMLYSDGTIAKNLKKTHDLPPDLVAFILNQIYERTVSQSVELLRKYENGTDFVYGELKHVFITDLLVRRLKMTSSQVFVDLGSGVGNVALQAALEIGCESWGCEIMENACNLAVAQKKEFTSRCRLWGLAPGKVRLLRGDFTQDTQVHEALKRADVVLVNNQAFTSKLNDTLVTMFLDLKQGCKIISLRNLVHDSGHNINDVGTTILDVEHHRYPEGYVSWTDSPGTFCISTRK